MVDFTIVCLIRGCVESSRSRTQGEALAGGQGEPEDKERRRLYVPSGGAQSWNQPSSLDHLQLDSRSGPRG